MIYCEISTPHSPTCLSSPVTPCPRCFRSPCSLCSLLHRPSRGNELLLFSPHRNFLCFQALTNCPICNPFVFVSLQRCGVVYPWTDPVRRYYLDPLVWPFPLREGATFAPLTANGKRPTANASAPTHWSHCAGHRAVPELQRTLAMCEPSTGKQSRFLRCLRRRADSGSGKRSTLVPGRRSTLNGDVGRPEKCRPDRIGATKPRVGKAGSVRLG